MCYMHRRRESGGAEVLVRQSDVAIDAVDVDVDTVACSATTDIAELAG